MSSLVLALSNDGPGAPGVGASGALTDRLTHILVAFGSAALATGFVGKCEACFVATAEDTATARVAGAVAELGTELVTCACDCNCAACVFQSGHTAQVLDTDKREGCWPQPVLATMCGVGVGARIAASAARTATATISERSS